MKVMEMPRTLRTEIWLGSCAISELKNSYHPQGKKMAAKKENTSLAGQNLRDGLLKDYTNLQCRISY